MEIDAEHIQRMIGEGTVRVADRGHTRRFGEFLDTLSWDVAGVRLSWQGVPHVRVDLGRADILGLVAGTRLGAHANVLVMFAPDEPGLICTTAFAAANLDTVYWGAPGVRHLCGAEVHAGEVVPAFKDLAEFDGERYLVLRQ
jgi:hypothetical protein